MQLFLLFKVLGDSTRIRCITPPLSAVSELALASFLTALFGSATPSLSCVGRPVSSYAENSEPEKALGKTSKDLCPEASRGASFLLEIFLHPSNRSACTAWQRNAKSQRPKHDLDTVATS